MSDLNRNYVVKASVREASSEQDFDLIRTAALLTKIDETVISEIQTAAGPLDDEGRPRMLILSSWIAHEGRNTNGQVFIKEELKTAVAKGLFQPPHGGLIDLDHDFSPRGFWFTSKYAFDEVAETWGIVAEGAIWAWRFEDLSNALIAETQRNGYTFVSMSALPESVELTTTFPGAEGEFTEILHNPVFYGASLLTVAPGDPNARALVSESETPNVLIEEANNNITATAELTDSSESDTALVVANQQIAEPNKEEVLMEELETLKTKLTEALEAKATADLALSSAKVELETVKQEVSQFKTDLETAQTKIDELQVALSTANETKAAVEAEFATAKQELEVFQAEKQEAELTARLEKRLSQLPEAVARNLEQHENAEEIKIAWKQKSDEDWEQLVSAFQLAASVNEGDLVDATNKEGPLSANQREGGKAITDLSDCIRTN